jgi:hypothetical protein
MISMTLRISQATRLRLAILVVFVLGVGPAYLYYVMPFEPMGHPTLVGRGRLSCGEMMLTQTLTGRAQLGSYVVSLYFRPPEAKEWAEFYLDHESLYWRGSIEVAADGSSASFYSYGSLRGTFSCADQRVLRAGGRTRLGPKASVTDPLTPSPSRLHNSPMDVGAASNDPFPGYRWSDH